MKCWLLNLPVWPILGEIINKFEQRGPRDIILTIRTHHYIWWPDLRIVERRQKGKQISSPEDEIQLLERENTEKGALRVAARDLEKRLSGY